MFAAPALRLLAAPVILLSCLSAATISSAADSTAVPATMQAIAMDKPGGLEVMTRRTVPVPKIESNEILIAVHAAGVAVWDLEIRESAKYIANPKFPYILGSDGSGVVAAIGRGVTRFKVGDKVYAYCWDNPKGGFYAEYVAVSTNCVAPLPHNVTLEDAGVLGASGLTAMSGIDRTLRLKRGETLIIHGASGAVGTLALQMAKARGAQVLATTSGGEEGIALARRLGADVAIDGRKGDIAAAAREFAPTGADAMLALAGGDALKRCMEVLRSGGRVAYPTGIASEPQPRAGITIAPYDAIAEPQAEQMLLLNKTVEAIQNFQIPIGGKFALADAAKAQERLAAGGVLGKIELKIQ
jgi:NADPH:quinone reductase-like Zn-dependent oxidoreductase